MKSALLVIDVQQSFRQRPYWRPDDAAAFVEKLQGLIDACAAREIPVLQIFHIEEEPGNPFARASGFVRPFPELRLAPVGVFYKSVHSAMFASNEQGQS